MMSALTVMASLNVEPDVPTTSPLAPAPAWAPLNSITGAPATAE